MLGLRRRFEQETTYTRVGPVLMAVNPNRVLPEKPGPHVTDVALAAMRGAVDEGRSQAVVISGESGAGKTVSATKIIEFDIDPRMLEEFSEEATKVIREHMDKGVPFVLVTSPDSRPYVRMIVERIFATLPVLSHVEIAKGIEIKLLGSIS